jgi:hypothetical protein
MEATKHLIHINKEFINKLGYLLPTSMKSESINEVISFLHKSTAKIGNVPVLKISNKFWLQPTKT